MKKKSSYAPPGSSERKRYLQGLTKNELIRIHRCLFTGEQDPGIQVLSDLDPDYLIERVRRREESLIALGVKVSSNMELDKIQSLAESPRLQQNTEGEDTVKKIASKKKAQVVPKKEFQPYRLEPKMKPKAPKEGTLIQKVISALIENKGLTTKDILDILNQEGKPKLERHVKNYLQAIAKHYGYGVTSELKNGDEIYKITNPKDFNVKIPKYKQEKEQVKKTKIEDPPKKTTAKKKSTSKRVKPSSRKVNKE